MKTLRFFGQAARDVHTMEKAELSQWQKIEALFHHCLTLPAAEQEAYLRQQTIDEPSVCDEVLSLLAHSETTLFMDNIVDKAAQTFATPEQDLSGQQVGQYRLLELLNEGGMGRVYLAERADKQFEKQVAIKFVKTGFTQDDLIKRFVRERQILANLEHPNIARLLDGGATEDNHPYLVMEYIVGQPVDTYCKTSASDIRSILKMFMLICDAIQFAHRQLIVHCDIKPSNILVDANGVPHILDFGISDLIGKNQETKDEMAHRLTYRYSSPEQRNREAVTTQSDVYSLGILLEELLKDADIPLDTELNAICIRATQERHTNRYMSVDSLKSDIDAYLNHIPLSCMDGGALYRSRKFVRRNLYTSGLAFSLVCIITGFTYLTWEQAWEVRQERDKAQSVSTFLSEMLASVRPENAQGKDILVKDVLDSAAQKLDDTHDTSLASQPSVEVHLRRVVGRTYIASGHLKEALSQLLAAKAIYQQSGLKPDADYIKVLEDLSTAYHLMFEQDKEEPELTEALRLSRMIHGDNSDITIELVAKMASLHHMQGKLELAKLGFREDYEYQLRTNGEAHEQTIQAMANMGVINHWLGTYEEADSYYQQCYRVAKAALTDTHPQTLRCLSLAGSLQELLGNYVKAEELITAFLAVAVDVYGEHHHEVLRARHNLADSYRGQGRYAESEALFLTTLEDRKRTLGPTQVETLQSQMKLARLYRLMGQHEKALPLNKHTFEQQVKNVGAEHPTALRAEQELADTYRELEQHDAAIEVYWDLVSKLEKSLGLNHPELIDTLTGLALSYLKTQDWNAADQHLQRAIELAENNPEFKQHKVQDTLNTFVETYRQDGQQARTAHFEQYQSQRGK